MKPILFFGIIVFLLVGFLGLGHFGINMNSDGVMPNCPVMKMAVICQMNPLEHILAWQSMFTFAPNQNNTLALLLLLLASTLGVIRTPARYAAFLLKISPLRRQYELARASFVPSLQEAFSSGILHPKIF